MKEMKIIRAAFLCVSTMLLLVMTGCSSDNGELTEMSAYKYMEKVKEISCTRTQFWGYELET